MAQTSNASRDFTCSLHSLLKTALDAIGDRPLPKTELLANICIKEKVFEKESPFSTGGYFHIVRSRPSDLLKCVDSKLKPSMIHRFVLLQYNTVILRTPKSNVDQPGSNVNQHVASGQCTLDSLATEIQILKDERLKNHPNVVELLGLCWEFGNDLRRLAMPVMVLETAEAGDMSTYLRQTSKLGARDRLRLAIHCFEGLRAVHDAGVIHADIKPENVLIFADTDERPHAKLTDFGSSVLLSEVDALTRLKSGTLLWQSPKVSEALNVRQLRAADIYSLTLVTSLLLIGYPMDAVFEEVARSGDSGKSLDELKAEEGALAALILRMQSEANKLQGTCFNKDVNALIATFFRLEVSLGEEIAIAGTDLPLRLLRAMLHRELVIAVTGDVRINDTLDELEEDVYLCPDIFRIGLGEVIARWYTAATDINQQADPESPVPLLRHPDVARSKAYTESRKNMNLSLPTAVTNSSLSTAYLTRPSPAESIISFNQYFSRLRRLPARVTMDFHVSLGQMADSGQLDENLRGLASYEMAAFIIGSHRVAPFEGESLQDAGKYLLQAAELGCEAARIHVGTILDWIGMSNPIDKDIEAGWLYASAVAGNLLASSRLKILSPLRHIEAIQERVDLVASKILGSLVISSATSDQEFSESAFLQGSQEPILFLPDLCLYLVGKGWHLSFQVVLQLPGIDLDMDIGKDSTLLLCACQKGDYVIARLLIEHGATPKANSDGLTPLHYLHSFPDEQILPIAKLLKDSGADLEARCELQTQCTIGQTDLSDTLLSATALLFAVANRNLAAISALISLGADPFNGAKPYEKYDHDMPDKQRGRIYSPVHYAARLHLSDVLHALLPQNKKYGKLWDWMCYETRTLKVTPLWCAVDYWYQGLWDRVLLHRKDHVTQCKQTINILLNRGSQGHAVCYDTITRARQSVFTAACLFGQPFVLSHLRTLEMEPTTENLIMTLQNALEVEDSKAIGYLLPIAEEETSSSEQKFELKASIQGHKTSDYVEYLYRIKERLGANSKSNLTLELVRDEKLVEVIGPNEDQDTIQQGTSAGGFKMEFAFRPGPGGRTVMEPKGEASAMPPKGTPLPPNEDEGQMSAFEIALLGGCEERARKLYEEHCDTLCRRTDANGQSTTFIGRLIQKSRRYSTADKQISFLLELTPPSHEEFFDPVVESDAPTKHMTILHLASVIPEGALTYTPRAPREIISDILRKYPEPEYLNAMTCPSSEAFAAIHLAVETGNLDALKEFEYEELDWNIIDWSGCTPMDVSGLRQQNVHNFLQNTRKLSRDENPSYYRYSVNEYRSNVVRMQELLFRKGGRHKKYGGFMYRRSEDIWELTEFQNFVCKEVRVMEHLQLIEQNLADRTDSNWRAHVEKLRAWSKLKVDESMLCPLLSDLRPGTGGHTMMEPEGEPSAMPPKGTPLPPNQDRREGKRLCHIV